ncbi:hypothetical protein L596_026468 [Steinernema carpocapsae]|uniref:Tyrosine specific protein phosphatases domain-containing protein n=1 Tax=Steinernema carpocapsae TaxID=34508 RepID=A0A4U5M1H1_STECR|nr:hypothetical protein L596_026468 [Steinernema carpocapsae]
MGRRIPDTRFIAFKTPLCHVYTEQRSFRLLRAHRNDRLTFTYRYYDRKLVEANYGAIHKKIGCGGHNVEEQEDKYLQFRDTLRSFWSRARLVNKLVGVHCTHGLNRTGYMVCRYLIEEEGWDAEGAIDAFDAARGHPMERENYKQHLIEKYKEVISSIQSHKEADEIQKEETQV